MFIKLSTDEYGVILINFDTVISLHQSSEVPVRTTAEFIDGRIMHIDTSLENLIAELTRRQAQIVPWIWEGQYSPRVNK